MFNSRLLLNCIRLYLQLVLYPADSCLVSMIRKYYKIYENHFYKKITLFNITCNIVIFNVSNKILLTHFAATCKEVEGHLLNCSIRFIIIKLTLPVSFDVLLCNALQEEMKNMSVQVCC